MNDRLNNLSDESLLEQTRIIRLGPLTGRAGNIEDLFTDSEYLALYNQAFGDKVTPSDLSGSDSVVDRLRRQRGDDYSHAEPAIAMLTMRDSFLSGLSSNTIDRFEVVFEAVNATS